MKNALVLILLLAMISFAFAQDTAGKNSLTGKILDAQTKLPLDKAIVRLSSTTKFFKESLSDTVGNFLFRQLPQGNYTVTIDFLNHQTFKRSLSITGNPSAKSIGVVLLQSQTDTLQGVTVTGTRAVVENKIDRLVYNVEKDLTSQGGVATDVLRKIPQVTVDASGNVELLGNPSVRFLINGKPSSLFGNSVADALQSIPVSQIQSIEVMTSPGAKYDATGTGGIINIVLKKNKLEGFNGLVNLTGGTRLQNGSVNLSWKRKNVGLNGFFNGSYQYSPQTKNYLSRQSLDTATGNNYMLSQNGTTDFSRSGQRSGIGLDWDITPLQSLSLSVSYDRYGLRNSGTSEQAQAMSNNSGMRIQQELSVRNASTTFDNYSMDLGLDYKKKFKRDKQELSFSYVYSFGTNKAAYNQQQFYQANSQLFAGSRSTNPGKDDLTEIALDYTHPVGENVLLEAGLKSQIENLQSNADVYTLNAASGTEQLDTKQSYQSTFKRQVYAAYASGNFSLLHFLAVQAGLRYEFTKNKGEYSNAKNLVIPDYNNLGPSIILSHKFKTGAVLKGSYAYRLERPQYRDLNPFINLTDPHTIITGNPLVKPEISHDYQLGLNKPIGKQNNINTALYYTRTRPDLKNYTRFYPVYKIGDSLYSNVNVTMRDNIASEARWGLNVSSSFVIASRLTLRNNLQAFNRQTTNPYSLPFVVSGWEYRINGNLMYQISKDWVGEAFGNYNSGVRWQGRTASFSSYTAAIRKSLFNAKGSIGITAVNAFNKYLKQRTEQTGTNFDAVTTRYIPYRSFGINFVYKFGNFKSIKPKTEDDYLTKPPVEN